MTAHDYPVTRLIARYRRVPSSPHRTDCPETGRAAEIPFIIDSTTSSAVSPVNRDQRFRPKSATRIYTLLLRPHDRRLRGRGRRNGAGAVWGSYTVRSQRCTTQCTHTTPLPGPAFWRAVKCSNLPRWSAAVRRPSDKRHETRIERERSNSANFHRNKTLNARSPH